MGGLGIIGGPDPHHFSPMAVLHNDSLETARKARPLSINIHLLAYHGLCTICQLDSTIASI